MSSGFFGLGMMEILMLAGAGGVALVGVIVVLILVPRLTRDKSESRNE